MSFWLVSYRRYVAQISLILEAELTHAPLDVFSHHFSHKALTHKLADTYTHAHTHTDDLSSKRFINRAAHTNTGMSIYTPTQTHTHTKP